MLLEALASRATVRVWFGVLRDNLGDVSSQKSVGEKPML
jgi:hypothetical protein